MSGFYRRPDEFVPPRTSSEHPALRLALEPRGDPPRLVLVPTDIFARSYLELAHLLWRRQLKPTRCAHCHQWFPPKRDGQRFCHGSSCKKDHDAAYAKHPYRKEYQKMYARYRRRTITQNEWDDWRDRNPGPGQWEGANPNGVGTED